MKTIAIYASGFTTPPQGSLFSGMICVETEDENNLGGKIETKYFTLKRTSFLWKPLYAYLKFIHHKILNKFI